MRKELDVIIEAMRRGDAGIAEARREVDGLSTGQRCYIGLASGWYGLLPEAFDAVEAWHRLDPEWQRAVCRWRGWPEDWTRLGTVTEELARVCVLLDAAGVPAGCAAGRARPADRVRWLADQAAPALEKQGSLDDG